MSRINDSQIYNINLENEVSRLLSHFESDFVFDVVENNVNTRLRFTALPMANLCGSFEQTFKSLRAQYPVSSDQIMIVRSKTYAEILDILCRTHNLSFRDPMNTDLYGAAYYLYGFLVSDFQQVMISFLTKLIIREKDNLLPAIGYDDSRKFKESNTIHGIRVAKDVKITILSANLDKVLGLLSTLPITLYDIISMTYTDPVIIDYLSSVVYDNGDFYKEIYMYQFNNPDYAVILTSGIRLELQAISMNINPEKEPEDNE